MSPSLLDTNVLSDIIRPMSRRFPSVLHHAKEYLKSHGRFTLSELSCYEIRRGLRKNDSVVQLAKFELLYQQCDRKPVSDDVLDLAATLWADGRRSGIVVDDCDVIIAATAMRHGLVLVTANTRHFNWIAGLAVEDWRQP
jgi:predicted nucleic acid-binding protein